MKFDLERHDSLTPANETRVRGRSLATQQRRLARGQSLGQIGAERVRRAPQRLPHAARVARQKAAFARIQVACETRGQDGAQSQRGLILAKNGLRCRKHF